MHTIDMTIGTDGATAVAYLHDTTPELPNREVRPAVVICPGGGYTRVSAREGEPVASALFAAGYHVFILAYSVEAKAGGLRPLCELSSLIMALREEHETLHLDPDRIAVMGFSAGGHLAASLGTLWNHDVLTAKIDTMDGQNRPNALLLCYPVISADPAVAHQGSIDNVSGGDPALRTLFSLENQVSTETPPTFLWHTYEDTAVPVENTLLFSQALRNHGVPFESHIFERGGHGLSMCNMEVNSPNPNNAIWFTLCVNWLNMQFGFQP